VVQVAAALSQIDDFAHQLFSGSEIAASVKQHGAKDLAVQPQPGVRTGQRQRGFGVEPSQVEPAVAAKADPENVVAAPAKRIRGIRGKIALEQLKRTFGLPGVIERLGPLEAQPWRRWFAGAALGLFGEPQGLAIIALLDGALGALQERVGWLAAATGKQDQR
jgi:hypothetical protein